MKSVTLKICPTYEAERDKNILQAHDLKAVVVPYYKAPSFYVGDNQLSQILVREDELEKARHLLDIKPEDQ
ncbi:MAG: hypothetical protein R6U57_12030 [Anaerolineales bacterium]